jgi:tetratricopeptide (TPR) repeat protein
VAFVIKSVVLSQLGDHPLTQPDAGLDTTAYVNLARQVLSGNFGLGPGVYYVSPLYIYFLAGCLAVLHSFTAVRGVQIVLGTASIGCIYLTARHWFGARAALIAAVLAALTGLFTFYEVLILQASIDAFLTSVALYALTRRQYWLAGVIFGIQTLNRPNILIAALGVALVMLVVTRRVRPPAVLVLGLVIGMSPAAIRNAVIAHQWSFVSSHGGLNFYIGNSERATGFYVPVPGITPAIVGQEKDARRVASDALGHPVTDAEASDYFFSLAWKWMAAHPIDASWLLLRKVYFVFNAAHVPLPHSYPFYVHDAHTILPTLFVGPWFLIPLGLAGLCFARSFTVDGVRPRPTAERTIVRGRSKNAQHSALDDGYLIYAAFVPAYAIAVALFFIAERYRLPLLVPLCAGAGAAIDWAWSAARARGVTALARPAAVAIALGIAANWPLHLNDGRWDEGLRMAQQLVILQRYAEADQWAERLDARGDPRKQPGDGHYGVGSQLLVLGQAQRALVHFEKAHAINPASPRFDYALGQALLKSGRAAEAIPHLQHGFDANVEIPLGGYDLAVAQYDAGDLPGAVRTIARINPARTEDVEPWLRLGRIATEARAPEVAERFFRHAAESRPDFANARQQYGLNLLVLGRPEEAARELSEAVRLDPKNPDSLSGLALSELKMGRLTDARAHAAAALALNPDDQLARGILRGGGT